MIKYYCDGCNIGVDKADVVNLKIATRNSSENKHYCPNCYSKIKISIMSTLNTIKGNGRYRVLLPEDTEDKEDVSDEEKLPEVLTSVVGTASSVISSNDVDSLVKSLESEEVEESKKEESVTPEKEVTLRESEKKYLNSFETPEERYAAWLIRPIGTDKYRKPDKQKDIKCTDGTSVKELPIGVGVLKAATPIEEDSVLRYLRTSPTVKLTTRGDVKRAFAVLVSFYRGDRMNIMCSRFGCPSTSIVYILNNYANADAYQRFCLGDKQFESYDGGLIDIGAVLSCVASMMSWDTFKLDCCVTPGILRKILEYYLNIEISEQVIDTYVASLGG